MRNCLAFVALLLVGCADDAPADPDAGLELDADVEPDARGYEPRLCEIPTDLPDPQVITGDIYQGFAGADAPGATVDLVADDDGEILATAATDATGHFALAGVANGGLPVRAHFRVTKAGYAPTLVHVVDGWRSMYVGTTIYTPAEHVAGAQAFGTTWDQGDAFVQVALRSCNNGTIAAGLAGGAIAFDAGPPIIYLGIDGLPADVDATTDSGMALSFGVPAGTVAIDVEYEDRLTTTDLVVEGGAMNFLIYSP